MGNVIKHFKNIATIHDAAVDAGVVEHEKIGKYIPKQLSAGSTGSTISSIARVSNHAKRVKSVAAKTVFLGAALAGSYLAMNKKKEVDISARSCKHIDHTPENLTIKDKFNPLFQYHHNNNKEQFKYVEPTKQSLVDIVKDNNLSAQD
jgi:hypothetical protein